ncbi:ATP-dependent metallopeptidase FtsH/Yme1/Tma family protein [Kitasatospora camelliae]|uniref:ATP-dependent metallopeptidase FtsH/Yme1/Tma family protein n=1 Tax=Kitasatospora camelliae TaxID=3156397 RepID=A0AAU8JMT3_9ACTN
MRSQRAGDHPARTLFVLLSRSPSGAGTRHSYGDFTGKPGAGQVQTVEIADKGAITGELKDGTKFTTRIPTVLDSSALATQLQSQHVEITAKQSSSGNSFLSVLLIFLPLSGRNRNRLTRYRPEPHHANQLIGQSGRCGGRLLRSRWPWSRSRMGGDARTNEEV